MREKGPQVHIIATSEMPVSEVSRAVISALTWGLGFEVPSSQITVVQSSLSREELHSLLGPGEDDTAPTSAVPEASPSRESEPKSSVPDTGLVEFSLGSSGDEQAGGPGFDLRRLELQDLELTRNPQGGFGISVHLADNNRIIGAQREAAGTEEDLLEVPASAALGVIQEFLRAGRKDALNVVLRFLAARRLRHPQHGRRRRRGGGSRPRPADSYDRCRLCRQRSREGLRPGHASSDQRVCRRHSDRELWQRGFGGMTLSSSQVNFASPAY